MKLRKLLGIVLSTILVTCSMVIPSRAANYDNEDTEFEY